ncbi:MAG: DUF979 domain-containing protein [Micropepsaceae bacterium]
MITYGSIYILIGLLFLVFSVLSARDATNSRRWTTALFWILFATSFLAGDYLTDLGNGVLVLAMALVAGFGGLGKGSVVSTSAEERRASSLKWGNLLFVLALIIPAVTLAGTFALKSIIMGDVPIADPKQATLISLAIGAVIACVVATLLLRQPLSSPFQEGRRLVDTIGWAALLPQMLASLGAVFAAAGVGKVVGDLATQYVPADNLLLAVAVYCAGMALFTMVMGNAFAAFPVLASGIGIPLLIQHFGGNPAAVASIGMLAGFCGTLMTPLAANFNIVPAALLDLQDRNLVIRMQIPTALIMLLVNTTLMYVLAFN